MLIESFALESTSTHRSVQLFVGDVEPYTRYIAHQQIEAKMEAIQSEEGFGRENCQERGRSCGQNHDHFPAPSWLGVQAGDP